LTLPSVLIYSRKKSEDLFELLLATTSPAAPLNKLKQEGTRRAVSTLGVVSLVTFFSTKESDRKTK
jgi:hypothetical protein